MVQYKKDEIKERIDSAALCVFSEKGFVNAKMADIATRAEISVGNLYRYYRNKDELFYTIIPPSFTEQFKSLLFSKITSIKDKGITSYKADPNYMSITGEFFQFLLTNKERFIILIEHGQSTKYSDFRRELVDFFIMTFMDHYISPEKSKSMSTQSIEDVLRIVYDNLISMFSEVLKRDYSEAKIKMILRAINNYHLAGVNELVT